LHNRGYLDYLRWLTMSHGFLLVVSALGFGLPYSTSAVLWSWILILFCDSLGLFMDIMILTLFSYLCFCPTLQLVSTNREGDDMCSIILSNACPIRTPSCFS
jgi:hypothetical protein